MRVLVVEDDLRMAAGLRRTLEREGYAVDVEVRGDRALDRATDTRFDAVILEEALPSSGGAAFCRELRTRGRSEPVLLLTDATDARNRGGPDLGVVDRLAKPFALGELEARVRALVRRRRPERSGRLRVGDIELNADTRTVTRAGVRVELTPREFALLELLVRHPGEVLSRARILEAVWEYPSDGRSNVVDVYVGYLRRKLAGSLIRTVRGAGYTLEP